MSDGPARGAPGGAVLMEVDAARSLAGAPTWVERVGVTPPPRRTELKEPHALKTA
ncbi:hypothetical protein [Streptomyces sp. YS-3]|uniref:hypothetical protein n=1 Tax=Streptomyces sp. YS-3 TaxID=3381352 RepID=UPI0038629EF3